MSDIMSDMPRFDEAFDILRANKSNIDEVDKIYEEFYKRLGFDFMETPDSLQEIKKNEKDMITNMKRNLKKFIKEKLLSREEYNGIIRIDKDDLKEFRDGICNSKKFKIGMEYIWKCNKYDDDNREKLLKDIWTERFKYTTIKKQADAVLNDKIETTPEQKKLIEEYEKNRLDKGLDQQVPLYLFKQYDNNVTMGGFCPICYGITHHGVPEGRITSCESRSMPKCKVFGPINKRQHEVHNLIYGADEYFLAPGNVILHED